MKDLNTPERDKLIKALAVLQAVAKIDPAGFVTEAAMKDVADKMLRAQLAELKVTSKG